MAGSVNRVFLIGNLGNDPEIRRTQDGKPIANLRIATSETWRDKSTGERKEKTEWHRVVIFNEGLCKVAEQYLRKGSTVYIEGALETRKWQDQSGQDRYTTEIEVTEMQMLGNRRSGDSDGGGDDRPSRQQSAGGGGNGEPPVRERRPAPAYNPMEDDIPF